MEKQKQEASVTAATAMDRVKISCSFVRDNASHVKINTEGIEEFVSEIDWESWAKLSRPVSFPLNFTSVVEEVNFIALINILNFGSGFRRDLHKHHESRGAFNTILRGVMTLFLTRKLNTDFLCQVEIHDIAESFDLKTEWDKPVDSTGVITIREKTELHEFAALICKSLNELGSVLRGRLVDGGVGEYIEQKLVRHKDDPNRMTILIEDLIKSFPASLNDVRRYKDHDVFIYKKVQILCCDLFMCLANKDSKYNFPNILQLTVFSDNVLPCVLEKFKILQYSEALNRRIQDNKQIKQGDEMEIELRTVAIVACEEILHRWNDAEKNKREDKDKFNMNVLTLDYYLWRKGKDEGWRDRPRHYTRSIFY